MTTDMETYRAGDGRLASPARRIGLARCGVVKSQLIPVAADFGPRLTPRPRNPILASSSGNTPVSTHKLLSDQPVPTGAGACAEVGSRSTAHADKRPLLKSPA